MSPFTMEFMKWFAGKFGRDPIIDDASDMALGDAFEAGREVGDSEGSLETQEWIEG